MQHLKNSQIQIKHTCGKTEKKLFQTTKLTNVSNNIMMNHCMDTQKLPQQWKSSKGTATSLG